MDNSVTIKRIIAVLGSGGRCVAITGANGSGKSEVADALARAFPDTVKYIKFTDSYGVSADREYYHQQRWNHGMWDDQEPSAGEILKRYVTDDRVSENLERLLDIFGIRSIMDKLPITFSSGEMRKYMLTKALMFNPEILLIDNPFIGLDPRTRNILSELLEGIVKSGLNVVLVLSRPDEIPDFVTCVFEISDCSSVEQYTLEEYRNTHFPPEIIRFRDVTVRYGDRTILDRLNWTVRKGEHWALTGENGCGKSTLLSLVCADNPMAYACDIDLFGSPRGSGESIWDIKKKIGYVSPELHRSYRLEEDALNVVASGLFDTVGLFYNVTQEQREGCRDWMEKFGIGHLSSIPFLKLSSGEQRLCLVCRAFVKNPPLLILDEPFHGLDDRYRSKVRQITDDYFKDSEKTLVMVTHYPEEFPSCIDHSLTLLRH